MGLLDKVLEITFPTRCVSCGKSSTLLCAICESKLRPLDTFYCVVCGKPAVGGFTHPVCRTRYTPERALSGFAYKGPARNLVKSLKYRGIRRVGDILANLLLIELAEQGITFGKEAAVIPIPLSFWRKGTRGFNQSELLARSIAKSLDLDFRTNILKKVKDTSSQVSLSQKERSQNIKGVFEATEKLKGKDILLVDDVLTTGATVREAAKALKKNRVNQVWVLTFAKD